MCALTWTGLSLISERVHIIVTHPSWYYHPHETHPWVGLPVTHLITVSLIMQQTNTPSLAHIVDYNQSIPWAMLTIVPIWWHYGNNGNYQGHGIFQPLDDQTHWVFPELWKPSVNIT